MTEIPDDRQKTIETLTQIVDDVGVAMLTTVADDGSLHSRPMLTASPTFDPELFFITEADDEKCTEIRDEHHVAVNYACPNRKKYVSISGVAVEFIDAAKVEALWRPEFDSWFSNGPTATNLRLIMVRVQTAEYWDDETTKLGRVINFVKSIVSGTPEESTEHGAIDWQGRALGGNA